MVACAIGTMFNYTPAAMTAIGRPYLSALPTALTLVLRIAFAFFLFDGSIASFSWVICGATIAATPVIIAQQYIYLRSRFSTMLVALWPSAAAAIACMTGAALLKTVLPASLSPIVVFLVLALPLCCIWYFSLRITSHPLAGEINKIAAGLRAHAV